MSRRYAGWAGLAGWIDATTGILGQYELTIEDVTAPTFGYREVTHAVTLEIYMRFDQL